jgi:hypothetical protein
MISATSEVLLFAQVLSERARARWVAIVSVLIWTAAVVAVVHLGGRP